MTTSHLLADYETLVQQHQAQFTPLLEQLQTSVNQTLQQLQQQERSIVAAQAQQLAQLQAQLATDARRLLGSIELQTFVAQVQTTSPYRRWNQTEPTPDVDSATWQLTRSDLPLAIRDYEPTADHDAYDDERTHTTYGYSLTLQLGDRTQRVEVLTQRVYSPVEDRPYSLRQQLDYYIDDAVTTLLAQLGVDESGNQPLAQEICLLVGCAARLLALTPQTVQFRYSSLEATA
ncbi:MAG: hypothetical protein F6K28_39615 [Microcoleus sp. SIO2G3]|nr:hypothetical protein [Microcoleus sp. SIO2G3]